MAEGRVGAGPHHCKGAHRHPHEAGSTLYSSPPCRSAPVLVGVCPPLDPG